MLVSGNGKPGLKGSPPFDTKSPRDPAGNYPMMYEGPPVSTISYDQFLLMMKKYSETKKISDQEKRYLDMFTSFHKFGVKTEVVVSARQVGSTGALATRRVSTLSAARLNSKLAGPFLISSRTCNNPHPSPR